MAGEQKHTGSQPRMTPNWHTLPDQLLSAEEGSAHLPMLGRCRAARTNPLAGGELSSHDVPVMFAGRVTHSEWFTDNRTWMPKRRRVTPQHRTGSDQWLRGNLIPSNPELRAPGRSQTTSI